MKRLNGVDAMMLYSETPEIHMHTLKIGVLDVSQIPGYDFDLFRKLALPRLHALAPLRCQLVDIPFKLHHPMWVQDAEIDVDYHIRRARVRAPGGRRELDELIGEIASTPLDRSRPLWEMYVAEGLPDNKIAVIHKVHHVLADGMASANQMAMVIGAEEPDVRGALAEAPPDSTAALNLLRAAGRDHARGLRRLPMLLRETAAGVARVRRSARERGPHPDLARNFAPPSTFINHVVSPVRRFATAPLALADVKDTARHLGVTLNDIVLATAAGALRSLQLRYDGAAEAPLIAGVPVSVDTSPTRIMGNEFTYTTPSLPVHIADPLERVRLESSLVMNLTISNVPGPRERGLVQGATVSEIYSVGPIVAGSGMNITVWSYVDQLSISVLTDDRTLDDPHEATDALLAAFAEIRAAAGLSEALTPVASALPLAV